MPNPHVPIMLLEAVLPYVCGDPKCVHGAWMSGKATVIRRGPLVLFVADLPNGQGGLPMLFAWSGKGEPAGIPTDHVGDWLSRSDYILIPQPLDHPAWHALTIELEYMQKEIAAWSANGAASALGIAAANVQRHYRLDRPPLSVVPGRRRNGGTEAPVGHSPDAAP